MDFLSSQISPSYQLSPKRPVSQLSSDDDGDDHNPSQADQDDDDNHNPSPIATTENPQKEWEDLFTSSIASAASDELHERRPNRWKGNPSTWRTWTNNERKTWESIENVRKADLSVHLYNAFALKKGIRKGPEERFLGGGEGQNNGGWNVGRGWTAWPLEVEEVPGDELLDLEADDGNQGFMFRREEGGGKWAGRNLEEVVSATVLRLAKKRFDMRVEGWEGRNEVEQVEEEEVDGDVMHSIEQGDGEEEVGDKEDEGSVIETGYDTAAEDGTDANGAVSTRGGKKRRMSTTTKAEQTFTPVMSADDERNYALVRPAARRIMERLDKTLMVLHHARAAAVKDTYGGDTDEDEDSEDEENEESRNNMMDADGRPVLRRRRGRSRTRSRSRAGSRLRKLRFRSKSRSSSSNSSGSNVSTKISRIGLQNWRDVLGAAALAGFSPEVIARATQRCSNLFNEEMVMHTLPEQAVTSGKPAIQTVRYQPKLSGHQSPLSDEGDYEYNEQLLAHRRTINRQSTAAITADPANAPAPAAKRASTPAAPSRRNRSATPGASSTGGGRHLCPFIDCPRAVEGFSRNANLQRHIRLVHQQEPPVVQITDDEEDSEDGLAGGVHIDGFLQPIKIRKGWRGDDAAKRQRKFRTKPRFGGPDIEDDDDGGRDARD
ncbi:hypothetical protein QBC36DRAFT_210196 [Triangularia setosa]|uniref:C2H2-type domain-containing protein n=1 Tax=Triangularia setosa TaxID=2587417 RepID=A0AAN6WA83_9PEZI|nr:hypothetical protein QBC36DRAFT_210196 [Podospora setosa]